LAENRRFLPSSFYLLPALFLPLEETNVQPQICGLRLALSPYILYILIKLAGGITMHHIRRSTLFLVLLSVLAPSGFSQLRNLSEYTQDRINPTKTYFVLHETGSAEFVWSSEWTHTTANALDGKSAIFVWQFKDGSKAYSQQGVGIGEIGKSSGYLLTDKSADLEDIHRKKIQPLTLNNYPVKVELWIGGIGDSEGYSLEIHGDDACVQTPSIKYNIPYSFSECPGN
jgi:hypothetical protein